MNQKEDKNCRHNFLPLGFEKISTSQTFVEVVACIVCSYCGLFKTKILYFDRQHNLTIKPIKPV